MNKNNRKEQLKNQKVILSIDNLKKYFVNQGEINKAVDGVSFDVHEGEIVGLIGESGSGKTTVGKTILRLFDDYNGFIRLEDKIIAGKKISSSLNRFLRKNVQMIFQDPHASLNSQQNIYSILKEPLIVNGIMKSKLKDLFKDWQEVKKVFKYTFQYKALELELDNYNVINSLADNLFHTWNKKFADLEFEKGLNNVDNFAKFYSYLEEKQHIETLIINNMYANTEKLINFYYEYQQKYRRDELEKPQLDYREAKEKYEYQVALTKQSKIAYETKKELAIQKQNLENVKKELHHLKSETLNTFNNYIIESKNERSLINIARLTSTDLDLYVYYFKNIMLFTKRAQVLSEVKKQAKYLGFSSIKDLITRLDEYIKQFFEKNLYKIKFTSGLKKQIESILSNEFKFNFDEYVELSNKNLESYNKKISDINDVIASLNKIISENSTPEYSDKTKLEDEKELLAKSKETYEKEKNDFLTGYRKQIVDLYHQVQEAKKVYNSLVALQTNCNLKYEEYKNKFWEFLTNNANERLLVQEQLLAELKVKEQTKEVKEEIEDVKRKIKLIKNELQGSIKIFKSDTSLKEETLKSFDIEKKYLLKDIANIYILLGVNHKWVIQNLQLSEAYQNATWTNRFSIYDNIVGQQIAKFKIGELLSKIIIYKALEDVGLLKQFAYRYPHEFSGGQLQRIVIARALITEPKIIVADEPIASLDISIQAQVVNLLKELCLNKKIGLIFIAHDLSMIEYVADKVEIMHLGKIVESGDTTAIYKKPVHPYTINLFKAIPKISNANEKFQSVSFVSDYLLDQQFPNVPETHKVQEDHYVYGTDKQVEKWISEAKEQ
ncbi:ATP-binding cassette domain-containing protein [Mycoplasma struthionis]|uniref:ATP-binding cassette domain-containing protein n=1 Tax=Mycoplasma struthionis TaxID=538220 RepID=A0A0C5CFN9_9MOLU|nr:ATP-binding cassette domain-containing protein [Mycoplasma struthionis]AJN18574.1 oligopeptide ABC transporter ATP-binding protein OppF [Mycoplasma struthionis]TPI01531.1 ATP-binding cassette domain-containing protein [Mycoplasma struthionis]